MSETGLTPLEHDVIAAFVRPSHPVMDAFREQFAACRVTGRDLTGVGFYTHLDVPKRMAVSGFEHLPLSDINAEIEGVPHGAGFVLWVIDGLLNELEGFVYDGSWPDRIDRYEVTTTADQPGWRNTPTDLESVSFTGPLGMYVRLLDVGGDAYRPVEAERIDRVTARLSIPPDYDPAVERWEFEPGTIVGLARHRFDDGVDGWLAVPRSDTRP